MWGSWKKEGIYFRCSHTGSLKKKSLRWKCDSLLFKMSPPLRVNNKNKQTNKQDMVVESFGGGNSCSAAATWSHPFTVFYLSVCSCLDVWHWWQQHVLFTSTGKVCAELSSQESSCRDLGWGLSRWGAWTYCCRYGCTGCLFKVNLHFKYTCGGKPRDLTVGERMLKFNLLLQSFMFITHCLNPVVLQQSPFCFTSSWIKMIHL